MTLWRVPPGWGTSGPKWLKREPKGRQPGVAYRALPADEFDALFAGIARIEAKLDALLTGHGIAVDHLCARCREAPSEGGQPYCRPCRRARS